MNPVAVDRRLRSQLSRHLAAVAFKQSAESLLALNLAERNDLSLDIAPLGVRPHSLLWRGNWFILQQLLRAFLAIVGQLLLANVVHVLIPKDHEPSRHSCPMDRTA